MAGENLDVSLTLKAHDQASAILAQVGRNAQMTGKSVQNAFGGGGGAAGAGWSAGFVKQMAAAGAAYLSFQGIVAGAKAALTTVVEIERGLIGLGKTADISGKELRDLGQDILSISETTPTAAADLLEIAAIAAQLGVRGSADIRMFTETIAQLQGATNLHGAEGATIIARLMKVTHEDIANVGRIGSVIVELGNNSAATEAEIVRMAGELGRATAQFGVTATETLGLGAAMVSLGMRMEETVSVAGRVMRRLSDVVKEGGASFEALAILTGESVESLKRLESEAPLELFLKFLEGLKTTGSDAGQVLKAFGLEGDEVNKALPTLAQNIDFVRKSLEKADAEFEANTARLTENERGAEGLGRQWTRFGTAIAGVLNNIAGDGSVAYEVLRKIVEVGAAAAEAAKNFPDKSRSEHGGSDLLDRIAASDPEMTAAADAYGPGFAEDFALVEARKAQREAAQKFAKALDWASEVQDSGNLAAQIKATMEAAEAKAKAQEEADKAAKKASEDRIAALQREAAAYLDANENYRRLVMSRSQEGLLDLLGEDVSKATAALEAVGATEEQIYATKLRLQQQYEEASAELSEEAGKAAKEEAERRMKEIQSIAEEVMKANDQFRRATAEQTEGGIFELLEQDLASAEQALTDFQATEAEFIAARERLYSEAYDQLAKLDQDARDQAKRVRENFEQDDLRGVESWRDTRLSEAAKLYEADLISAEEYANEKRRILDEAGGRARNASEIQGGFGNGIGAAISDLARMNSEFERGHAAMMDFANFAGGTLADSLKIMAGGTEDAGEAWKKLAYDVLEAMTQMILKQAAMAAVGLLLAPFTAGASIPISGAVSGAMSTYGRGGTDASSGAATGYSMSPAAAGAALRGGGSMAQASAPATVNLTVQAIDSKSFESFLADKGKVVITETVRRAMATGRMGR